MKTVEWSLLAQKLHAAALDGHGWESALQEFARATGSRSTQLCGIQGSDLLFNVITDIDPTITRVLAETAAENPRVPIANNVPVLKTVADGDFLSPEQHRHHPFYRQVCSPWDVPYICLTALERSDDMSVILAAIRSQKNGHITKRQRSAFTKLARHVQGAIGMHMAIERNGSALVAGALEALQCAAFICGPRGYVRAMTPAAERLVSAEPGLSLRGRTLSAGDEESTRRLLEAIRAAGEQREAVDRFRKRTVRVAIGQAAVATIEVFALPEHPYDLPFWPTVLIVVRNIGYERDDASSPAEAAQEAQNQWPHTSAQSRAQRAESALDAVAPAAFILDGTGRVVHHNAAARWLLRQQDGLQLRGRRLRASDPLLQDQLQALIDSAAASADAQQSWPGGAITLPRPSRKRSLQVMVLPRRLRDTFAAAHALVLVGDPDRSAGFPEAILSALYGLTHAEVEISNALLDGRTIEQIAEHRGVTVGTLRIQMKSIFQKTDTRRQTDLLKLLLSLPAVPPLMDQR